MAYRAVTDPRIAALKQLLATEPELLEQRVQLRRAYDALQEQADQLGIEVAARDEGLIAKVLGRTRSPEDRARAQRELDEITPRLAALQTAERDLEARLDELTAARRELTTLVTGSAEALRSADGPVGDELRAIHAALQADDEQLAALDAVIVARDRAETVISGVLEAQRAADEESSPVGVATKTAATLASIASFESPPAFGQAAARVLAHMPEGRDRIAELVALLDAFRQRFDLRDRSLDLVCAQLASLTRAGEASSAATCLERLLATLTTERARIVAHRGALENQQRQILERAV